MKRNRRHRACRPWIVGTVNAVGRSAIRCAARHSPARNGAARHSSAGHCSGRGAISDNGRCGFTLIELLLVLSMVGSLLGGTIGLLSLTQTSNQQGQENLLHRQEIRRFADDVRRDMRASTHAEIKERQLVLTVESPESEIVYRAEDGSLIRRKTTPTDPSAASQDQYRIGTDATIAIEWLAEDSQIQWTITSADRPKSPVRIIASMRPSR